MSHQEAKGIIRAEPAGESLVPAQSLRPLRLGTALADAIRQRIDPMTGAPMPWNAPAVSGALRAEAAMALPVAAELCRMATEEEMRKWLGLVGLAAASSSDGEAAFAKVLALSTLMKARGYPAGCFIEDAAERMARGQKWMPSYAEISEFLGAEAEKLQQQRARLQALAVEPSSPPKTEEKPKGTNDVSAEQMISSLETMEPGIGRNAMFGFVETTIIRRREALSDDLASRLEAMRPGKVQEGNRA